MKGIDVLVVRLMPFILFGLFIVYLICGYLKIDVTHVYKLHGNSAIYALSLFLISLANKKYHCVYNRAMYIFLITIPIINYLEVKFHIFPNKETHILFIVIATIATALITAYLAIRHFVNISKRKLNNGNNQ